MRYSTKIISLLVLTAFLQVKGQTNDLNNQVISSDEIINSGSFRNDYLFSLLNRWDRITTDGYNWSASANGLSSFQKQNWILILNGQRMDLNFLNSYNINTVPFLVSQVDSVEVLNSPAIRNGEFSAEGLIHVHTRQPKKGFSLQARVATGNVSGDPGPFVFTEYASDNIEEDGPEFSLSLDYGSESWFGRLLLFTETFAASDAAIRSRNEIVEWDSLKVGRFMPSIQIGTNALNGSHNFFAGYSSSEQQSFYPEEYKSGNLLYVKEAVRDYLAHSNFKHAGLNGFFNLSDRTKLNYQLKVSGSETYSTNKNRPDYFEQSINNYLLNAEMDVDGIKLGSSYDYSELEASYSPDQPGIGIYKVYGELPFIVLQNITNNLSLYYVQNNTIGGIKTSFINYWSPAKAVSAALNLAYTERIPDEERDIWFFVNNGYDLLNHLDINYDIDGVINKSKKFTADLNLNWTPDDNIQISFGILYRNFFRTSLEFVEAEYIPGQSGFNTSTLLNTNSSGQIIGTSVSVKNIICTKLNHEIFYRYQDAISGDEIFLSEWRSIPTHKIVYKFSFEPFPGFRLWSKINYLSSTTWSGFRNVEESSDGLYNENIESSVVVNLSANKWFWQERIRLGLLLKNVFNDDVRYHPVSPVFPLSLYFQAELLLNSLLEF
jgi:hypothetical protein